MLDADACLAALRADTVLAFDYGEKRIGVAIGNGLSRQARPLAVIAQEQADRRFAEISQYLQTWQPKVLVVGTPSFEVQHAIGQRCQRFARQLVGRYQLPVKLVDESFSSTEAEAMLLERRRRGERNLPELDALAAALFLQQVLDELP